MTAAARMGLPRLANPPVMIVAPANNALATMALISNILSAIHFISREMVKLKKIAIPSASNLWMFILIILIGFPERLTQTLLQRWSKEICQQSVLLNECVYIVPWLRIWKAYAHHALR